MANLTKFRAGVSLTASAREVARVERAVGSEVLMSKARAHVAAERARANTMAVESAALDAMQAGVHVTRQAVALAEACPAAEPMLRTIVAETGMAMGQIVSDTARDLR